MLRRAERVWRDQWGVEFGATLSCGHFVGSETRIRSRESVDCPACPDQAYEAMNRVYRLEDYYRSCVACGGQHSSLTCPVVRYAQAAERLANA